MASPPPVWRRGRRRSGEVVGRLEGRRQRRCIRGGRNISWDAKENQEEEEGEKGGDDDVSCWCLLVSSSSLAFT